MEIRLVGGRITTMSVSNFVKNSVQALKSLRPDGKALFVTGNESADLDSCASSILNSFLFHRSIESKTWTGFRPDVVVPLINVPREDFTIRQDVVHLMSEIGINFHSLFFRDDLESLTTENILPKTSCYSFLVDFNKLNPPLDEIFEDRVVGILDHHDDEGLYRTSIDKYGSNGSDAHKPRWIQKSGSCSSLVVKYWTKVLGEPLSDELKLLALGPLLIDTSNMTSKVEPIDQEVYEMLAPGEGEQMFKTLKHYKTTLDGLSGSDILKKDYKQWGAGENIGISSVPQSLQWICGQHKDFWADIKDRARQLNVSIYGVMTSYSDNDEFKRDLALVGTTERAKDIIDQFVNADGSQLQLEPVNIPGLSENASVFMQKNVAASRKQVAPLLRQFVEKVTGK